MEKYRALNDLISRFDPTKITQIPNGPLLYWNFPELGSLAYLHRIHFGLSQKEFIEWQNKPEIPNEIVQFLFHFNGISLFRGAISIYGYASPYSHYRNKEWLPYSIELYEIHDRPDGIQNSFFIFGTANRAMQLLCYDKSSRQIHIVCKDNPARSLRVITTFEEFLSESIATLEKRFLENNNNADLTTELS
jgi:hypothetical protein